MHNASVMPMWRCFWIQSIVIQNCEHGRWEFGGEEGSLEGAQEIFICTTFSAWHGGGSHWLVGHFYLLLKIKSLPSSTLNWQWV
jgi:hypothetical protein